MEFYFILMPPYVLPVNITFWKSVIFTLNNTVYGSSHLHYSRRLMLIFHECRILEVWSTGSLRVDTEVISIKRNRTRRAVISPRQNWIYSVPITRDWSQRSGISLNHLYPQQVCVCVCMFPYSDTCDISIMIPVQIFLSYFQLVLNQNFSFMKYQMRLLLFFLLHLLSTWPPSQKRFSYLDSLRKESRL